MNIRKPADYSVLFSELDNLMAAQLPQMELYCEIGRVVSGRAERGAAVAVSEYLQDSYPAAEGFSPRIRRKLRGEKPSTSGQVICRYSDAATAAPFSALPLTRRPISRYNSICGSCAAISASSAANMVV